jgi:putative transposase
VALMCRVLDVSTSGFWAWRRREPSVRQTADDELAETIRDIHDHSRGTYGAPRVHAELRDIGTRCGRKRVARLMHEQGLVGVHRRRYLSTTERDPRARPAPDLVERDFHPAGPDRLWVADVTALPTARGFLYLAVVLDAWSRLVVGWSMDAHADTALAEGALSMALTWRRPAKGLVHHSDQGSEYTGLMGSETVRLAGIRPSMGSVGDSYDNAMAESFFASLETELIDRRDWQDHAEARFDVFDWIAAFYNPTRRHSALGYLSPQAFEAHHHPRRQETTA